ncbi:MAG: hypothetical protein JNJ61_10770 [Anaerolineae bacterium]|nr:hypothetical protein [Anaerolineae bacterium]
MRKLLLIVVVLLVALIGTPVRAVDDGDWLTPEELRAIIRVYLPGLPATWDVYYNRSVRDQSLPGYIAIGEMVRFDGAGVPGAGLSGTQTGAVVGYLLTSEANTLPTSMTGAPIMSEWPTVQYIVSTPGREVALRPDQVIG